MFGLFRSDPLVGRTFTPVSIVFPTERWKVLRKLNDRKFLVKISYGNYDDFIVLSRAYLESQVP